MEKNFYLEDILSQGVELRASLSFNRSDRMMEQFRILSKKGIKKVIFSGMGSSHYCAYGADIRLKRHGINSQIISTGELIYYEKGCIDHGTVLCLISQSGESAETKRLLDLIDPDIFVIAVTNQKDSTLAKRGNLTFMLNVSDEISVTTRTYVSSLVLGEMIAAAVCKEDVCRIAEKYEEAIRGMSQYLQYYEEESIRMQEFCKEIQEISLIGRGNALSTVRAGSLFFREVSKFPALDFDSAEFRHGPMEMVQDGFYAMIFAPSGETRDLEIKMAQDISIKGGKVLLVTDTADMNKEIMDDKNILTVILDKTEEYASQILQIVPVQLLANAIAEVRGFQPGVFRWGSKVMTEE